MIVAPNVPRRECQNKRDEEEWCPTRADDSRTREVRFGERPCLACCRLHPRVRFDSGARSTALICSFEAFSGDD